MKMLPNRHAGAVLQVRQALGAIEQELTPEMTLGVTGGRYRDLPEHLDGYRIRKVDEMRALGFGRPGAGRR